MAKAYKPGVVESILAAADLEANRFIGFDGNLCGANAKALGVSETSTKQGQYCPVIVTGIALVESGGAVSAGAAVASDAAGRAVAASNFTVSTSVSTDVQVTVTVPVGEVSVLSTAAQPDLLESATATSTATNTLSGGVLPQKINGWALDAASGAGELIRVLLA